MRENRFFIDQPLHLGCTVDLERTVAVHISKVLRMTTGEQVTLFNGDGTDYIAELTVGHKQVSATVVKTQQNSTISPLSTELGQGICRGDRMDYSIQKAVEMGVSSITPIVTERVQFRMDIKRLEKKMRHWQGIIIAACEQCGRADVPHLNPVTSLSDWLTSSSHPLLTLDPLAHSSLSSAVSDMNLTRTSSVRILVGPEGGLTADEIQASKNHGQGVSLGPRILRTETAGTAILALLQHQLGDI